MGDSASGVSQPLTQHLQPLFTPVLSSPLSAAWPEGDYCCLVRQEQGESERVFVQCHTRRKKTWSRTWVQSSVPSPGLFLLHFVPGRKRDGSGEEGGRDTCCTFAVCHSASVQPAQPWPKNLPHRPPASWEAQLLHFDALLASVPRPHPQRGLPASDRAW